MQEFVSAQKSWSTADYAAGVSSSAEKAPPLPLKRGQYNKSTSTESRSRYTDRLRERQRLVTENQQTGKSMPAAVMAEHLPMQNPQAQAISQATKSLENLHLKYKNKLESPAFQPEDSAPSSLSKSNQQTSQLKQQQQMPSGQHRQQVPSVRPTALPTSNSQPRASDGTASSYSQIKATMLHRQSAILAAQQRSTATLETNYLPKLVTAYYSHFLSWPFDYFVILA